MAIWDKFESYCDSSIDEIEIRVWAKEWSEKPKLANRTVYRPISVPLIVAGGRTNKMKEAEISQEFWHFICPLE